MRRIDFFAAIGLLGFVALMVFVIIPRENTEGIWYGLSPYFYPHVMLAGMALSCIGLLVQSITRPDLYTDQPNPIDMPQLGFFLASMALIVAGVLLIDYIGSWVEGFGFRIGGALVILAMMLFMGERNMLRLTAVPVLAVAFTWLLVTWGLKTPLP